MNEAPAHAALVALAPAEMQRRAETALALECVLASSPTAAKLKYGTIRRHVRLYYGPALADGMTVADMKDAARRFGATTGPGGICPARLVQPSRAELVRLRSKWTKGLPAAEIPMIKRQNDYDGATAGDPLFALPEGTLRKNAANVTVQSRAYSSVTDMRDGGTGKRGGGTVVRRRRFPAYLTAIRKLLDSKAKFDVVDRDILEHVVDGRSLRWIGDELGLSYEAIRKRIRRHTSAAGVKGPGPGR